METATSELLTLVDRLEEGDWRRPTRCPPLDVAALVAHVAGSFRFVETWLTPDVVGEAVLDRSSMWRAFPQETSSLVVDAAVSSTNAPHEVRAELHAAVRSFEQVSASLEPHQLAACQMFGPLFILRTQEVIANRVLEVAVHLLDLQAAVGAAEVLPRCAAPVLRSILDGLLGQAVPEPFARDDLRYVLVATGRASVTDQERHALGAISDLFPLLT
jgi:uncharacterized protein (TIGR03083 family)